MHLLHISVAILVALLYSRLERVDISSIFKLHQLRLTTSVTINVKINYFEEISTFILQIRISHRSKMYSDRIMTLQSRKNATHSSTSFVSSSLERKRCRSTRTIILKSKGQVLGTNNRFHCGSLLDNHTLASSCIYCPMYVCISFIS